MNIKLRKLTMKGGGRGNSPFLLPGSGFTIQPSLPGCAPGESWEQFRTSMPPEEETEGVSQRFRIKI